MRSLTCHLILLICTINVYGQKAEYFEFSGAEINMIYSVFDSVEFVDSRLDRDYAGILQKRTGDKPIPIWLHNELSAEIKKLIDSAAKSVPRQRHTVLINFRNFFINEQTGHFEFHVGCYAKWDNEYWLVYRIDSAYTVKGGNEKSKLYKKVNETVNDFIGTLMHLDLSKRTNAKPLTLDYINNIDVSEKKEIPVFNTRKPAEGIYFSYDEFKNNHPRVDKFFFLKKRGELQHVYRKKINGKQGALIPRDSVYAVFDGESLWIAADNEYAQLNKRGLNFFFRSTGYEGNRIEEVTLSAVYFGMVGAIFASIPRKALFEFRLNHINGKFIFLRRAAD